MSYSIYIGRLPNGRWKVGCDKSFPNRPIEQDMRIYAKVEEHDCIYKASEREIELQKYYGVSIDRILYHESINRRSAGGKIGGKASVYGRPSPNRKLQDYQVDYIRTQYKTKKYSLRRIAKAFQVSYATIQNVINQKHYG